MIPLDPRARRMLFLAILGFSVLCVVSVWYVITEVILK